MAKKKNFITKNENGEMAVVVDKDTFGILDDDLACRLLEQAVTSTMGYHSGQDAEHLTKHQKAAVSLFYAIKPQDEMEGMLASQMVANHFAVMKSYERASFTEQPIEIRDMYLKHAAKLSRIYIEQVTALNKMRGKGQQKVTVEHIHIHSGGQAIVGNVNSDGGRVKSESEEQAHAQRITNAPEQAMPRQDTKGDKVSVTSHEER